MNVRGLLFDRNVPRAVLSPRAAMGTNIDEALKTLFPRKFTLDPDRGRESRRGGA